jgi:hypothetical protein
MQRLSFHIGETQEALNTVVSISADSPWDESVHEIVHTATQLAVQAAEANGEAYVRIVLAPDAAR